MRCTDNGKCLAISRLRVAVTLNHFKRLILGDQHVPGVAQRTTLFNALALGRTTHELKDYADNADAPPEAKFGMTATSRSWESWFGSQEVRPKDHHIESLNKGAVAWLKSPDLPVGQAQTLPERFYEKLFSGGLSKAMLSDVRSSDPAQILKSRAAAYFPASALHLHLDALELLSYRGSLPKLANEKIVAIAGARIFELLYLRWGDTDATDKWKSVYSQLPSEKLAEWDTLLEADRERRLAEPAFVWQEDPVAAMRRSLARRPSRALLGSEADATPGRIYRLLFAIGADSEFLGDDAVAAWALDLASAGAAAIALYFAGNPYVAPHREQVIIAAIDSLLFGCHIDGVASEHRAHLWGGNVDEMLRAAMSKLDANWGAAGTTSYYAARKSYRTEMHELGFDVEDVYHMGRARSTGTERLAKSRHVGKMPKQSLRVVGGPDCADTDEVPDGLVAQLAKLAGSSK